MPAPAALAASPLRGIVWVPLSLLLLIAAVFLTLLVRFVGKRIRLILRIRHMGLTVRGLHPLWLVFSLPRRADFVVRGQSKTTYAVRFAESWLPNIEYAVCSADRWYKAVVLHLPPEEPMIFHLGFIPKRFLMDFRADAAEKAPDAVPLWLFYPRIHGIVSRTYDTEKERDGAIRYKLLPGESVDGILLADGASFLHLLNNRF